MAAPWSLPMFGNYPVRPSVSWWKLRYHRKLVFPVFLPKRDVEDSSLQSSRNIPEIKKVPGRFQLSGFSWHMKYSQKLMAVLNWHPSSLKYSKPLLQSYPREIAFSLIWLGFIITKTNRQILARGRGTFPLSWGTEGKRRDCNFAIAFIQRLSSFKILAMKMWSRYIRSLPRVLYQLNIVSKVPINFWEIELNSVSSRNLLPKHDIGFAVLGMQTAFGV